MLRVKQDYIPETKEITLHLTPASILNGFEESYGTGANCKATIQNGTIIVTILPVKVIEPKKDGEE